MEDLKEKLTKCVSTAELERRWKATREMMRANKIDYLVIQNSEEYLGGTIRWFTDFSARYQFRMTVIFPVDDEMTTITYGGDPPAEQWPPPWAVRGIKNRLGAPYLSTIHYTDTYDAELAVSVLKEKKKATIGLVERAFIPITFYEYLPKHLPDAKFVDATEHVDQLKAIKSPEEIELIKGTAALQDAAMEHLKKTVKPGMRDFEVFAELQYSTVRNGSECQLIGVGSGPLGTMVRYGFRQFQNRVIKEGDQLSILLETNGPGGYYTELLRVFMVGKKPSQELQDAFGVSAEAQALTASRFKPGADPKEIWDMHNDFLKKNGYAQTTRLYAHGQGFPLVERPLIRYNETWKLKAGMNIAIHPIVISKNVFAVCGDNYIIGKDGVEPCLHRFPKEIFVI
jgi:Xaa-Pro aminopeptidase